MTHDDELEALAKDINDHTGDKFRVVADPENREYYALYNGDTLITEDWDYEINARLLQIAKENGVTL